MTPGNSWGNGARWASLLVAVAVVLGAFAVQWGVVTTKLDHLSARFEALIVETRALRAEYQSIERRVSYLEGQQAKADAS